MQRLQFDGFALKWIAIASMVTDHAGAILFPQQMWMRCVGRIAFPIFCFLLAEGAVHTHNIHRYELRLLFFALLSELPFDLTLFGRVDFGHQNVFFTLLIGLVMIELLQNSTSLWEKAPIVLTAVFLAELLGTDYAGGGILIILCFYGLRQSLYGKQAAFAAVNLLYYGLGIQIFALAAVVPMLLYRGQSGRRMRYVFYVFYPLHLLILYAIKISGGI